MKPTVTFDNRYIIAELADGTLVAVDKFSNKSIVDFPSGQVVTNQGGLGNEKVAAVMATAGPVIMKGSAAAGPAAPVVLAVGAVITAIGGLIRLFGGKAKKIAAERKQWDEANRILEEENAQLSSKVNELAQYAGQLKTDLRGGLGFCLFNCKKKREEKKLRSAKDKYEVLVEEQEEMISIAQKLANDVQVLLGMKADKKIIQKVLIAAGGLSLGFIGYSLLRN
jgi:hypothetical protein